MNRVETEITKEEYERLSKCENLNAEIEPTISDIWRYGYGWYGCRLLEHDNRYYIEHNIGSSCD